MAKVPDHAIAAVLAASMEDAHLLQIGLHLVCQSVVQCQLAHSLRHASQHQLTRHDPSEQAALHTASLDRALLLSSKLMVMEA